MCCKGLVALAVAAAAAAPASAQDFPDRAIDLVVPFGAGATVDVLARLVADQMSESLGQPVIVDNRPGADAQIGMNYVVNQVEPDGYTIIITSIPATALLPLTSKALQFDPLSDLTPFLGLVETRYIFGSSSTLPWTTLEELAEFGRENPGELTYGHSNPAVRFWAQELSQQLGIETVSVPYTEGGVYIQAAGSGEVSMGFISESSAISLGESFQALATSGSERQPPFEDTPTFTELGFPQIRGTTYALSVPTGTPQEVIDILSEAAAQALETPSVQEDLANMRMTSVARPMDEISAQLREEHEIFSRLAAEAD